MKHKIAPIAFFLATLVCCGEQKNKYRGGRRGTYANQQRLVKVSFSGQYRTSYQLLGR